MEIILTVITFLSVATLLSPRLNPMEPARVSSRPRKQ